jgi:uncharacterized protein
MDATDDTIPLRQFGRTNDRISALGLGGHHLGDARSVEAAIRIVHEAIDGGITFFDNCWEYWNGRSENWLGRALVGKRQRVFLMTKVCTHGRDSALALKMLEQSLRRLRTDHLDLWQVHGVTFDNDPALAYARGGVLEALDRAKQQGKTRYVGFTGHKDPSIHMRMLTMGYRFDAVQMPLNPFDHAYRSFEREVIPEANRRGVAVLGMKSQGGTGEAMRQRVLTHEEALRYAMSLPVATTIVGMERLDVLRANLRIARGFRPMTEDAMTALRERCRSTAGDGRFEPYKTSIKYDNPEARIAHSFPLDPKIKEVEDMFRRKGGVASM